LKDQPVKYFFQCRFTLIFVLLLGLSLTACSSSDISGSEAQAGWQTSAHARWYIEDVPEYPTRCAKCHNALGYLTFLGVDRSSASQVETFESDETTLKCQVCHNPVAEVKNFTSMPSGIEIENHGMESNCIECHQGLASNLQVEEIIKDLPKDQVDTNLTLPELHANAVGATFYGTQAKGGVEYPQYTYSAKFEHQSDSCTTCHDSHTLQVRVEQCGACHLGATSLDGVRKIRLSRIDYDGDGDILEGLEGEIETMMEKLWITMQLYTVLTEDTDLIAYNDGFFTEAGRKYTTWTPDLLQAAYNYHYAAKDPGSYSHNPNYIMQLLYDSIDELGGSTRGMTRPAIRK
jgi:Zn finger protein HypA/HybF involved in hydrogenase expression